jgi:hypothetical protein
MEKSEEKDEEEEEDLVMMQPIKLLTKKVV